MSLTDLLAAVAEDTPAPGAGSAAAWTGALAAALLEMVAGYAGAHAAARRAPELRARLLEAGKEELHAYEPVLAAARLEPGDPSREALLLTALSDASDSPLAIARAATEVAELAAAVAAQSKPALRGDAIAGVLLADAAAQAAARLVEINLARRGVDARLSEALELRERAGRARGQVGGS